MTKNISVVICFRDWGLDRLVTNVALHLQHGTDHVLEVVVSDYGSQDAEAVRQSVEAAGGRVARTESGGSNWNRSAALNAGIAAAKGEIIITTDADIFFTPQTYAAAADAIARNSDALYLVQCRDLPRSMDVDAVKKDLQKNGAIDFDKVHRESFLRPRWGMGGLACFSRAAFDRLNGYEERMELWGKEDTDFAKRFNLNRMPRRWISKPGVGIYHIWHESSQTKANETAEGRALLAENQRILDHEHTPMRNLNKVFGDPVPPISIIIPTYDRNKFLRSCLESVRLQTFSNFEVIVVENGGSRDAEFVVASMGDPRFRYVFTPRKGAAAARNIGVEEAVGRYVVIMDDDDLMVSTRVADHLKAITGGAVHGSYGGWIDFESETGEVVGVNTGKEYSFAAMWATGKVVVHAGAMLERGIFKLFRYDEARRAGIDYALIMRLSFSGLQLNHTGNFALLRRMHETNMTTVMSGEQKASASDGIEELKTVMSDKAQKDLRDRGRNAQSVPCGNESVARMELLRHLAFESDLEEADYGSGDVANFDRIRYAAKYPDVALSGLDPLQHYLRYGRLLGRQT